jgi:AcrR family transcriptional regulator
MGIIRLVSRDEEILDAAERLFFESGFHGVGVDDIGLAAGVSGSAIYRHFDSKDQILATLFDRVIDAMYTALAPPLRDPTDELEALIRSHVAFALEHRRLAGIWEREHRCLTEAYRRPFQRRLRSYIDRWTDCLSQLYPQWGVEELRTAVRAVQALLVSDSTRSGPVGRTVGTAELLVAMGLRSLGALAEVTPARS